jgi:DNA (cytosine-5)-methyltransferase 1
MLKIVETFSGIGSQAKAFEKLGIEHKILCTVDWDINAIIAYDLIHNGPPKKEELIEYKKLSKEKLVEILSKYTLSWDGKKPGKISQLERVDKKFLERLLYAINRSNNLVSITDIKAEDLPKDIDILTYSFPCQDLSVAGYWHGNKSGIDRNAHNRSGMLWEVERILKEMYAKNIELPKMLLMENVSNILSYRNKSNFDSWKESLSTMNYYNKVYTLDASKFGIPQKRVRTYMLSINYGGDKDLEEKIRKYFEKNNLEKVDNNIKREKLEKFIKTKYNNQKYKLEADESQANATPSRIQIYEQNVKIMNGKKVNDIIIPTITTKQDRNPNSGVIDYTCGDKNKAQYRFLTPRECFLLMGFEEKDYEILKNSHIKATNNREVFTRDRLNKLAGNSIVVNVLEKIFKQANEINDKILIEKKDPQLAYFRREYMKIEKMNLKDSEDESNIAAY